MGDGGSKRANERLLITGTCTCTLWVLQRGMGDGGWGMGDGGSKRANERLLITGTCTCTLWVLQTGAGAPWDSSPSPPEVYSNLFGHAPSEQLKYPRGGRECAHALDVYPTPTGILTEPHNIPSTSMSSYSKACRDSSTNRKPTTVLGQSTLYKYTFSSHVHTRTCIRTFFPKRFQI